MAINLFDEYKKQLQGIGDALSQAPIPYLASKIGPSVQNTANDIAESVGNFIKPTVSPLPSTGIQKYTDPVRNVVGQTVEDTIKRLPGEAYGAFMSSPPAQFGQKIQGLIHPEQQDQIRQDMLNNAYKGIGFAGEFNPTSNLIGGVVGTGFGMAGNVLNGKSLFDDYAKNFSQGYQQSAQFAGLSAINPLFAKELNNPMLTGVGRSFGGQLIKRAAMAGAKNSLEGGIMGYLDPSTKNRINNAEDQALFGFVLGALGQAGGDISHEAIGALSKQIGVGADRIKSWVKHLNTVYPTDQIDPRTGNHIQKPLWQHYIGNSQGGFIDFGAEVSNPMAGANGNQTPLLQKTGSEVPQVSSMQSEVSSGKSSELPTQSQMELPQQQITPSKQIQPEGPVQEPKSPSLSENSSRPLENPSGGSISQRVDNFLNLAKNKADDLYTQSIDRFHPLSKVAKTAGEDQAMRNALTGYYGSASTADYHLKFELSPILKSVEPADLRAFTIAQRDLEELKLGNKGSNQGNPTEIIDGLKQKYGDKFPQLEDAANKLYSYQKSMVQKYLVDTGIMSQQSANEMWSKREKYVPFQRVMDTVDEFLGMTPKTKSAGSVSSQDVIKGYKGSDKQIQDPLESIVQNTYKMVGLAKRQQVAQTIVNLAPKLPEGMITKAHGDSTGKSTISLFENGKVQKYLVPPEIADAAKGLSEESMNTLIKIFSYPTKLFRASATGMNPEFMAPNVARDLQSAFVNTGLNPLKWVSGLAHMIKQDDVYQEFLKSGAMTSRVSLDRPFLKDTVDELIHSSKPETSMVNFLLKAPFKAVKSLGLTITNPKHIAAALQDLGEYSEQPTRIAMFENALKKGLQQGLTQEEAAIRAANVAQEGTVNFSRRGSKTQSINAIYAFLNARVQGIDRLIRTIKNDPAGASLRIGIITAAPAIALYAHNRGFQSYNDPRVVSQNDKDNNFIIMLSDTPISQLGGAQYIKIPKGEIGKLANPIESFLSYAEGKGGDVQSSLLSALKSFSPIDNTGDLIPTSLRPVVENAANTSFFSGQQIVPDYKKNYPAGYQYTSYTSPVYRLIGDKLGISPAKIQNIVEGYATGWAKIGSTVAQPLIPDQYKSEQNIQGQDINRTPILRRFIAGEKRTPEEQQAIDEKKQEAMKFQVNDIKGGVNRGDIPADVGIKQIQKIENNPNAQYYIDDKGKLKTADLTPLTPPILTGQSSVDQLLLKDYSTALNKQVSDIVALNKAGKIDDTKAKQMINSIEVERFKASSRSGTKTQIRSLDQLKKQKDISSISSEQTQALKDFQDNKISASDLNTKLQSLKVKRIKLGGGKKPKKIKIAKVKKPKKIKSVSFKKVKRLS